MNKNLASRISQPTIDYYRLGKSLTINRFSNNYQKSNFYPDWFFRNSSEVSKQNWSLSYEEIPVFDYSN